MACKIIIASLAALTVTACATAPTLTAADYQARENMRPDTLTFWNDCIERDHSCQIARRALENDPATTPNILALFNGATRERQINRFVGDFLRTALLGPERRIHSCYRSECVTTTYRTSPDGRVVNVRSY